MRYLILFSVLLHSQIFVEALCNWPGIWRKRGIYIRIFGIIPSAESKLFCHKPSIIQNIEIGDEAECFLRNGPFVVARMKYFIIPNMWTVGMHHWGHRQLEVGLGYVIEREPANPKDQNAICVKHEGSVKAYLKKDQAFIISKVMKMGMSKVWRLKPKEDPIVRDRRTGPQQRCTIAFKVEDNISLKSAKELLDMYAYQYEIKTPTK